MGQEIQTMDAAVCVHGMVAIDIVSGYLPVNQEASCCRRYRYGAEPL